MIPFSLSGIPLIRHLFPLCPTFLHSATLYGQVKRKVKRSQDVKDSGKAFQNNELPNCRKAGRKDAKAGLRPFHGIEDKS